MRTSLHNAPGVKYPVGRFAWSVWAGMVLGLAAALLTDWLLFLGQISPVRAVFSLGVLCLVAATGLRAWHRPPESAWLVWDGQGWQWWNDADGRSAQPLRGLAVQADFQQVMLLRLMTDASVHLGTSQKWVWLYKGFAPAAWHRLRCAVYSRQY